MNTIAASHIHTKWHINMLGTERQRQGERKSKREERERRGGGHTATCVGDVNLPVASTASQQ